jgi:hypothetical protein
MSTAPSPECQRIGNAARERARYAANAEARRQRVYAARAAWTPEQVEPPRKVARLRRLAVGYSESKRAVDARRRALKQRRAGREVHQRRDLRPGRLALRDLREADQPQAGVSASAVCESGSRHPAVSGWRAQPGERPGCSPDLQRPARRGPRGGRPTGADLARQGHPRSRQGRQSWPVVAPLRRTLRVAPASRRTRTRRAAIRFVGAEQPSCRRTWTGTADGAVVGDVA